MPPKNPVPRIRWGAAERRNSQDFPAAGLRWPVQFQEGENRLRVVRPVEARLFDANRIQCLDARQRVRFGITGDGRLLDNLGTSTGSREVELYNGRYGVPAAASRTPKTCSRKNSITNARCSALNSEPNL